MGDLQPVGPDDIKKSHPDLRRLDQTLRDSGITDANIEGEGIQVGQQVPGDGKIQIHFGPWNDAHGTRKYILIFDPRGQPAAFYNDGRRISPPTSFSLNPGEQQGLLRKFFGPYALQRTIVSQEDAGAAWRSLQSYDVRNEDGSFTPDGIISHVDINWIAEQRGKAPGEVKAEVTRLLKK